MEQKPKPDFEKMAIELMRSNEDPIDKDTASVDSLVLERLEIRFYQVGMKKIWNDYCSPDGSEKWIAVEEKLPQQSVSVLIWHSARRITLTATAYNSGYKKKVDHWIYCDVDGTNRIDFQDSVITHWQPLPSPPALQSTKTNS